MLGFWLKWAGTHYLIVSLRQEIRWLIICNVLFLVFDVSDEINLDPGRDPIYEGVIQSTNYPNLESAGESGHDKLGYIRRMPLDMPVTFSLLSYGKELDGLRLKVFNVAGISTTFTSEFTSSVSLTPVAIGGIAVYQDVIDGKYQNFLMKFKGMQDCCE